MKNKIYVAFLSLVWIGGFSVIVFPYVWANPFVSVLYFLLIPLLFIIIPVYLNFYTQVVIGVINFVKKGMEEAETKEK